MQDLHVNVNVLLHSIYRYQCRNIWFCPFV